MSELVRTITHWTAGGGRASDKDKKHYHTITEFDGTIVEGKEDEEDNIVTSDGDYAAHTRNLNTGSIGKAMAGMRDATEYPLSYGPSPINRKQFEAHCKDLALTHMAYGIPVTPETCLTHAEVEPTLGVKQRGKWDLTVLPFEPTIRGAIPVGNYMRERVMAYMGDEAPIYEHFPTIRQGMRGYFVQNMQGLLADSGYFSGKKDGIFGPRTKEALMAFQSEHGLAVDGICGKQTWATLMRDTTKRPERDIDVKELRSAGSKTIKATDATEVIAIGGGGIAGVTAIVDSISEATGGIREATGALEVLTPLVQQHWPSLAAVAGAGAVWWLARTIKQSRIDDARSGKHIGR